jgi:hypothetical protein
MSRPEVDSVSRGGRSLDAYSSGRLDDSDEDRGSPGGGAVEGSSGRTDDPGGPFIRGSSGSIDGGTARDGDGWMRSPSSASSVEAGEGDIEDERSKEPPRFTRSLDESEREEALGHLGQLGFEPTRDDVMRFQTMANIKVDGIIGPQTQGALRGAMLMAGYISAMLDPYFRVEGEHRAPSVTDLLQRGPLTAGMLSNQTVPPWARRPGGLPSDPRGMPMYPRGLASDPGWITRGLASDPRSMDPYLNGMRDPRSPYPNGMRDPRSPYPNGMRDPRSMDPYLNGMRDPRSMASYPNGLRTMPQVPPPRGRAFRAKGTAYYPANNAMEGGVRDKKGFGLCSLQRYLAGQCPYVSCAMDGRVKYGQKLRIPELERKYGRPILFRVVDTGGAFRGRGTRRIDICVASNGHTRDGVINGPLTLVPV